MTTKSISKQQEDPLYAVAILREKVTELDKHVAKIAKGIVWSEDAHFECRNTLLDQMATLRGHLLFMEDVIIEIMEDRRIVQTLKIMVDELDKVKRKKNKPRSSMSG